MLERRVEAVAFVASASGGGSPGGFRLCDYVPAAHLDVWARGVGPRRLLSIAEFRSTENATNLGLSIWPFVNIYGAQDSGDGDDSELFTSSAGDTARGPGRSPTQESRRVPYSAALSQVAMPVRTERCGMNDFCCRAASEQRNCMSSQTSTRLESRQSLAPGVRVRMSAFGLARHPKYGDRQGLIVARGSASSWRVKFDERRSIQTIHQDYLEKVGRSGAVACVRPASNRAAL